MNELTKGVEKLDIRQPVHVGFADEEDIPSEVPFRATGSLARKLHDTPRYLFRVYSDASAGENSDEWMKSVDATENNLTDIFARNDASKVALALNEHLRWFRQKSHGDPFISWTTSLLFAIQYAIYKSRTEPGELNRIFLCIVDTTLFPDAVFVKDLDLIDEFNDKVPHHHPIVDKGYEYTWSERGLSNLHELRIKRHKTYSGFYYFGEYLSQEQTKISGRSCTVPCDKIINDYLFTMIPQFKDEMEGPTRKWAESVVKARESFYKKAEEEMVGNSQFLVAMAIALEFKKEWFLPMLANLLALNPQTAGDPANRDRISNLFSDQVKHSLSFKVTNVVANNSIPEVLEFGKIIHDINQHHYAESVGGLITSLEETTNVVRRFIRDSRTTVGRTMLGMGGLAGRIHAMNGDQVRKLRRSLAILTGTIQELQDDTT